MTVFDMPKEYNIIKEYLRERVYMGAVITPNEMQQKAIDILKGQVMLLAGPGTGKTFTVIHRIEKMLAEGIKPSSILCLTFSDAAANEMRQRLIKKMGVIASSVDIYTYHSFCNDLKFSLAFNSGYDSAKTINLLKALFKSPLAFISSSGVVADWNLFLASITSVKVSFSCLA